MSLGGGDGVSDLLDRRSSFLAFQGESIMTADKTAPKGGLRRTACFLFLACVLLYNLNHRYQGTADTAPNIYLPISVILHHDLYLDRYPTLPGTTQKPPPYYLHPSRGRLISSFPVLPALLAVPVYLAPALWLRAAGISYESGIFYDTSLISAKVASSMIAAGSVVFVFLTLAGFISRQKAFTLACLYAFGTAAFPIASQGLWGHGPVMLFLSAAAYVWLHHPTRLVALGTALALAVAARPAAGLTAVIFTCFLGFQEPRKLLRFLLIPALAAAALVAYNTHFYGAAEGGYTKINVDIPGRQAVEGMWTSKVGQGLAGLLISPSRGLLVFSPFLTVAFVGLFRTLRDASWTRWRPLSLSVLAQLGLFSSYSVWWGGVCYGPRYLADTCPYLVMLLVPTLPAIETTAFRRVVFGVLAGVSIFVQSLGAMLWTGEWYTHPTDVDIDHARLWDWKDTEITRTLRSYRVSGTDRRRP